MSKPVKPEASCGSGCAQTSTRHSAMNGRHATKFEAGPRHHTYSVAWLWRGGRVGRTARRLIGPHGWPCTVPREVTRKHGSLSTGSTAHRKRQNARSGHIPLRREGVTEGVGRGAMRLCGNTTSAGCRGTPHTTEQDGSSTPPADAAGESRDGRVLGPAGFRATGGWSRAAPRVAQAATQEPWAAERSVCFRRQAPVRSATDGHIITYDGHRQNLGLGVLLNPDPLERL